MGIRGHGSRIRPLLALLLVLACATIARAQGAETACWPGPEIENPHTGNHPPVQFPESLSHARTTTSVVFLKLCVTETGKVARVLVINGSGNARVDRFFVQELRKRRYQPVKRGNRAVPSVVPMRVTLYLR